MTFSTPAAMRWIDQETARHKRFLELADPLSSVDGATQWVSHISAISATAQAAQQITARNNWVTALSTPAYQQFLDRRADMFRLATQPTAAVEAAMTWLTVQDPLTALATRTILDPTRADEQAEPQHVESDSVDSVVLGDDGVRALLMQLMGLVDQLTAMIGDQPPSTLIIQNNVLIVIGLLSLIMALIAVCL